jgi:hypothetical protein
MNVVYTPELDTDVTNFSASPLTHMLRTYTYFIQNIFSGENSMGLTYSEDQETTDIIIRMANAINAEVIEKKPAVLVSRSGFTFPSGGIGGSMESKDLKDGSTTREGLLKGGVFFTVLADLDNVATDIAWYIVEHIWLLKSTEGGELFHGSSNFNISPPSPPQGLVQGDAAETVAVQVSFPVSLLRKSRVSPMVFRTLNKIEATLRDSSTQDTLLDINLNRRGTD